MFTGLELLGGWIIGVSILWFILAVSGEYDSDFYVMAAMWPIGVATLFVCSPIILGLAVRKIWKGY